LSKAIAKLTAASKLFLRTVKAPAAIGSGQAITLERRGATYAVLAANGSYTAGDETGTWSYTRTGAKTGVVTLTPAGEGATPRDVAMVFKNATFGAFNDGGVKGIFAIEEETVAVTAE
jgi:streptogramin lyase